MSWIRSSACCESSLCVEVRFHKSTYSADTACVEVGFHKSTASSSNQGCVDVKTCTCDEVLVRDSKDPDGPVLTFTRDEWTAFLAGVKGEEFELPVA
ncbi:MAG TPA: DUF397 domain-containing protein [Anaerolineales bacterium]